jgi:L-fuconolactonase
MVRGSSWNNNASMLIVDSQVHIWGADTPQRPWPAAGPGRATPQRAEPWSADEVIAEMNAAGVAATLLVPPTWEGERNDLAIDAVRRYPGRFAIMGRLGMDDPLNAQRLPQWRSQPGMLGIRFLLTKGSAVELQGASHWLWPAAEKAGVAITLVVFKYHALIEEVATRHPGLRISIDHMGGISSAKDEAGFANLPQLLALARLPNVAVKASSAPAYSSGPYPFVSTHAPLRRIFDAFGPRRMFWGSDLTKLKNCSYRQAVTMFTEELPWLKGDDLEWVMGRAVCDWLGWQPSAAAQIVNR